MALKYNLIYLLLVLGCTPSRQIVKDADFVSAIEEIVIDESMYSVGPCEPTISINPTNPSFIVAGSVLDNIYLSSDAGRTWDIKKLTSSFGVFGDPVILHDILGNPLYAHLSNSKNKAYNSKEFLDRIVVQRSLDGGKNWSDGSFPAVDHMKDHDKHWLYTDPITGDILMTWTEFDVYGSKKESDRSRILFSKSTDHGVTWSKGIAISEFEGDCIDDDQTTEGAHPCVGVDGKYYVVWGYDNKLYVDVSLDKGLTWMKNDIVVATQMGGWSYKIPGIDRCNGMPVIKCDHSNGNNRGNLYINWSDQGKGVTDTDVWLISSRDNGKTWSKKVRVNDDIVGRHQFLTWMDVDNTNGNIYTVFYDRRAYSDERTDVYLAYSTNGGKSFINKRISKQPFIPNDRLFFGDYNNISAHSGKVRPIWTAYFDEKLSVRTAIIDFK